MPMLISSPLDYPNAAADDSLTMLSSTSTTCSIITCMPPNFPWSPPSRLLNFSTSGSCIFCAEMCVVIIARSIVSLSPSHISVPETGFWTVGRPVASAIELDGPSASFSPEGEDGASHSVTFPFPSPGSSGAFCSTSMFCAVRDVENGDAAALGSLGKMSSGECELVVLGEFVSITQRRIKMHNTISTLQD